MAALDQQLAFKLKGKKWCNWISGRTTFRAALPFMALPGKGFHSSELFPAFTASGFYAILVSAGSREKRWW